ncbi:hypothetical protein JCM10207_004254 [Rhodosporidiobolus poonsookiae]
MASPPLLDPQPEDAVPPTSPQPKTVSFAPPSSDDSQPPQAAATTFAALPSPSRPPTKRRRSSIKQGSAMPYRPPKELYSHPDPLIRRLRLRDGYGKPVDLQREFADAKVVLFFFGATWPGSVADPFELVRSFAAAHPHQCKVVYVSVDSSEAAYENNTRQKPWLSMEWNDGSNMSTPDPPSTSSSPPPPSAPLTPLEPFLLAGDADLEEDLATSDPSGSLYLRPYSRVHLCDKWTVLGVPNLVVYHPGTRRVLSYHARFELLKEGKREAAWDKWSRGEKVEFTTADFLYAIRWSLGFAAIATGYMLAVRGGYMHDVVGETTAKLTQNFLNTR